MTFSEKKCHKNRITLKADILFRSLTDEELVDKIVKNKNSALFGVLYDRHCNTVYNKCYSFATNSVEAQDLTQDVFLRLFINLGSFKGKSKFSTWLYALTYNYCVNYVTRNSSKKIEKNSFPLDNIDLQLVVTNKNSLFELNAGKLQKALELVAPEDKMILLLKYQHELSIKELSEVLLIGKSAVKMRLKRARARIIVVYNKIH